jgi:hypothetical protein
MAKYSKEANENWSAKRASRTRRDVKEPARLQFPGKRTMCNLYLRVDPILYREIYRNEGNQVN